MKNILAAFAVASFIASPAFAGKGIIKGISQGGTMPPALIAVTEDGNGIAIDESGVHLALAQGVGIGIENAAYQAEISPKTGFHGIFRQKNLVIKLNDIAKKYVRKVDGYRLYLDLPGAHVSVTDDSVVEIAISENGVQVLDDTGLRMAITEQGLPKKDPKKQKSVFSLEADSTGRLEFAIKENGIK